MKRKRIIAADLFCGAGGTTQGLVLAANGLNADLELLAINHWQTAVDTHALNHPELRHLCTGLAEVDPIKVVPGGRLNVLCASPECTHHSTARGGKPMDDQSRSSPMLVLDWLHKLYVDNVIIENVPEFQTWGPLGVDRRPLKSGRGKLFNAWIEQIRAMDYRVEWRVLNCADYGAPTTRRRLFIIARKRNRKIVWPEPTHVPPATKGAGLFAETRLPWRTAREIIEWQRPSKDILDRKKPLSPNTLRRISAGMLKFNGIRIDLDKCVREGLRPYLVVLRGTSSVASVDQPLPTVTNSGAHYGLVQPFLLPHRVKDGVHDIDEPLRTVTATSSDFALVEPFTLQIDQTGGNGTTVRGVDAPLPTLVTKANTAVVEPFLIGQQSGAAPRSAGEPVPTIATGGAVSLTEPFIVPHFGERDGQKPRTHSVDAPAPAVTGQGAGSLIEPYLTAAGGATGQGRNPHSVDEPLGTVLTNDRRAVVDPFLAIVNHGDGDERRVRSVDVPMATVTGSMGEGVCEPFIASYYGTDNISRVDDPVPTVVTKDRFGLALPEWISEGDLVYRLEIRFRMLQPRELARAQGFPDEFQFTGNREAVVKQIGNAVPPPMAQALCNAVLCST